MTTLQDPPVSLEQAVQLAMGALKRLDSHGTFLGLFGPASAAPSGTAPRALADGAEQIDLPHLGLRVTLHERVFKLDALGIDATRMAGVVAGVAFKHAVQAEPAWTVVSRDGEPDVMEGSVALGPMSLYASVRAGEQAVAGRLAPGAALQIWLAPPHDAAPVKDDLSDAARAPIAAVESQRLGNAKVLLGGVFMQLRHRDSLPMTGLMDSQPLSPPLAAKGRNSLGQMVHADADRGIWTGASDDRFGLSCPASGPAAVLAAMQDVFQFFAGAVSAPRTEGEVTSLVLTSTGGRVYDLTFKAEATPFKDPGGRVVPGVTILLGRRPA